ncbi:MAG: DUF2235 domain-containing protein [Pseudomonadota bacterium]
MKRIVICCDGTWNELDFRVRPVTNVVKIAQSIHPKAPSIPADTVPPDDEGTEQIVFYDEGVGTLEGEALKGGGLGKGLNQNIIDAYTFLVFNYSPGDEIYIFGFSRGAYTARSLVGLIRNSGILRRDRAPYIPVAFDKYKDKSLKPDSEAMWAFREEYGYPGWWVSKTKILAGGETEHLELPAYKQIKISYLGVWDTVGTNGVPGVVNALFGNEEEHGFHDLVLSNIVERARHAIAIDEYRSLFTPALWATTSVKFLNENTELPVADPNDPPYQQMWFPGDHGSVGGGGDATGLSDITLAWVAQGAKLHDAGLSYDETFSTVSYPVLIDGKPIKTVEFAPTLTAPLRNVSEMYQAEKSSAFSRLFGYAMGLVKDDRIGYLDSLDDIHETAKRYRGYDGEDADYVAQLRKRILAYTLRSRFNTQAVDDALMVPGAKDEAKKKKKREKKRRGG